jgi:hypothetical protein
MLQVFYLDVAMTCCKRILQCFICFIRMLQLFHLSVAKVDLDVGLLSEEERASVGAMAALMWGGVIGHMMLVWKRRGSHLSVMEEAGEALVWKRRGQIIRTAWATERKGAVRTRALEAELARAACEAKRPRQSTRGRPGALTIWTYGR